MTTPVDIAARNDAESARRVRRARAWQAAGGKELSMSLKATYAAAYVLVKVGPGSKKQK